MHFLKRLKFAIWKAWSFFLQLWQRRTERERIVLLSIPVGMLSGLVASGFRYVVHLGSELLESERIASHGWLHAAVMVLSPAAGAGLVGFLIYKVFRMGGENDGVAAIIRAVSTGHLSKLRKQSAIKSALSSVVIATGGSAGPEGPIAELGSAVGLGAVPLAKVRRREQPVLLGCGIAGAISAIFNAPLAGVFFALEIILKDFGLSTAAATVLAAVSGGSVARAIFGPSPAFGLMRSLPVSLRELPLFLLLGVLCGLAAILFMRSIQLVGKRMPERLKGRWYTPAVGGLLVGILSLIFPQVRGEGYEFINSVIRLNDLGLGLLLVCAAKIVATSLTLGSGSPGGSFAPSLVIGAALGGAFAFVLQTLFPDMVFSLSSYPLAAMAGMIAAVFQAPITGTLILFDVTGGSYEIVLAALVTIAAAALVTSRSRQHASIYTLSLLHEGFDPEMARAVSALSGLSASDAIIHPPAVQEHHTLSEVFRAIADSNAGCLPVVDEQQQLVGIITLSDIQGALASPELANLLIASEMARPINFSAEMQDPLVEVYMMMRRHDADAIPVFGTREGKRQLAGVITRSRIADVICSSPG